jgi:hypothetical protein
LLSGVNLQRPVAQEMGEIAQFVVNYFVLETALKAGHCMARAGNDILSNLRPFDFFVKLVHFDNNYFVQYSNWRSR